MERTSFLKRRVFGGELMALFFNQERGITEVDSIPSTFDDHGRLTQVKGLTDICS